MTPLEQDEELKARSKEINELATIFWTEQKKRIREYNCLAAKKGFIEPLVEKYSDNPIIVGKLAQVEFDTVEEKSDSWENIYEGTRTTYFLVARFKSLRDDPKISFSVSGYGETSYGDLDYTITLDGEKLFLPDEVVKKAFIYLKT